MMKAGRSFETGFLILIAVTLPGLLAPAPTLAQGALQDGRMEVTLSEPGGAIPVRATFTILPEPGALAVPLSVLAPEPTRLESLRVVLGDQELERSMGPGSGFHLEEVRDHYFEGQVRLESIPEGEPKPLVLTFHYTIEGAWSPEGAATVPLVVPRWVPENPGPRTFVASVAVPGGYTVTGSFPTSVLGRPEPGVGGSYDMGLQGAPAMLVLRVVRGEGSLLTLETGLDAFVILVLLLMGAAGLRYLRAKQP